MEAEASLESWTLPARLAPTWPILTVELQGCHHDGVKSCCAGNRSLWGWINHRRLLEGEVVESTPVCDRRACLAQRGWGGLTRVTGQVGHKVGTRVQSPLPLLRISMGESSKVRMGPWEAVLGLRPASASRTLLFLATNRPSSHQAVMRVVRSQGDQAVLSPSLNSRRENQRRCLCGFPETHVFEAGEVFSSLLKGRISSGPKAVWWTRLGG